MEDAVMTRQVNQQSQSNQARSAQGQNQPETAKKAIGTPGKNDQQEAKQKNVQGWVYGNDNSRGKSNKDRY